MKKFNKIFTIIIAIIFFNVLSNYFSFNIDLTEDKKYTLSDNSKKTLSNINDILSIKVYLEGNLPTGFEILSNSINNFLVNCKKENSLLEFEFINPNDNDEIKTKEIYKQLQNQGLYPTDLTVKKSNETSRKIIFPGAIMYYKDKREAINLLENNFSLSPQNNINNSIENIEFHIISAISKLINNKNENH